jgi:hypothetical protein
MKHLRSITKTQANVVWFCTCGWMTWQRRAQTAIARNAKLLKAWRKHLTKTEGER